MALPARKLYEDGLADLRLQVELMGAKVDRNLDLMCQALETGDEQPAAVALAADDDIDATNLSLTERCYELMIRQAPVAGDLRLLVSVVRVTSDIERIGDLALRLVKLTPDHRYLAAQPALFDTLVVMAARAVETFREALSSWAAADAARAARLLAAGSSTAHLAERLATGIIGLEGPNAGLVAMRCTTAGQALDRIADHSLVIAARVRYLVTGDPAHLSTEVR